MSDSAYCEVCKKELLEIMEVIENIGDIVMLCDECSESYLIMLEPINISQLKGAE